MRGPVAGMGMGMGVASSRAIRMSPYAMFAAGEQGIWLDPSDLRTVFQDNAGTVPGAVGQPVGLIRDKSGRGNDASQAVAGSRPILRQSGALYYLEFDGVDDFLQTSSTNLSGVNKVSVLAGVRKTSDAAAAFVIEHSASLVTNAGSFFMTAPQTTVAQNFAFKSRGDLNTAGNSASGALVAPYSAVLTGLGDIAGDNATLRVNGVAQAPTVVDQGLGNFGNYPTYIGARGGISGFFNGQLFSLIVRGAATDAASLATMESWVNKKTGAY